MSEDLIKESNPRMLAYSAAIAVVIHAAVFFGWSKISMEQNAYAMGNKGRIEMVLAAAEAVTVSVPQVVPPQPVAPPDPVKAPSEFKKKVVIKPIEKKLVQLKPVAPVEQAKSDVQPDPNQATSDKVVGDQMGRAAANTSVAEPDYLNNPPPIYPNESRRSHEEGIVLIFAAINSAGKVDSLRISKSSGFDRLDNAATSAVKNWKFKPARFAGVSLESNVEIPVRFSLR